MNNPHYVSEEDAALNCAAGRHDWSLFGEGPAAFCLHCAATRRNATAPIIPAPKDTPPPSGGARDELIELLNKPEYKYGRQRLANWKKYKADELKVGAWLDALDSLEIALSIIDVMEADKNAQAAELAALKAERDAATVAADKVAARLADWGKQIQAARTNKGAVNFAVDHNEDWHILNDAQPAPAQVETAHSEHSAPPTITGVAEYPTRKPAQRTARLTKQQRKLMQSIEDASRTDRPRSYYDMTTAERRVYSHLNGRGYFERLHTEKFSVGVQLTPAGRAALTDGSGKS